MGGGNNYKEKKTNYLRISGKNCQRAKWGPEGHACVSYLAAWQVTWENRLWPSVAQVRVLFIKACCPSLLRQESGTKLWSLWHFYSPSRKRTFSGHLEPAVQVLVEQDVRWFLKYHCSLLIPPLCNIQVVYFITSMNHCLPLLGETMSLYQMLATASLSSPHRMHLGVMGRIDSCKKIEVLKMNIIQN